MDMEFSLEWFVAQEMLTMAITGEGAPLEVTLEDFQLAKTKVRPSAMREVLHAAT